VLFLGFPARRDDAEYSLSSRRNNEAGESKKCAILNVATFTHMVSLEMLKFFNEIKILAQFGSGQLPFLGS
jgi:hypothetical protein